MRSRVSWIGAGILLGCLVLMLVVVSGCPSHRQSERNQDGRQTPARESSPQSDSPSERTPENASPAASEPAVSARTASPGATEAFNADQQPAGGDNVDWPRRAEAARLSLQRAQAEQAAGDLDAALNHAITAANALPPKSADLSGIAGSGSVSFQQEINRLRSQIESTLHELDDSGAGAPADNIPNPELMIR